ncbi:MAG: hypothetical protein D4R67_09180 [Bacteroidetes bacterium]|nr:MAG: hypothetical protein D4R67_09180 [Bacteroidota bacterium]
MNTKIRDLFLKQWKSYFEDAELPIVFYYTDDPGTIPRAGLSTEWSCIICELNLVRKGKPRAWNVKSLGCGGARRYFGYEKGMRPNFEYFLSTGIPGEMEGERYIRTPEMVKEIMAGMKCIPAGGKYIVFKRFDQVVGSDEVQAVIFFATPDVLSGLFTLANFDCVDGLGVIAPFGSGCSSIVYHPYFENEKKDPKAVLGMFDVSARPCVPKDTLTFSVPIRKFKKMVSYMDQSFLITGSWEVVKKRL